MGDIVPVSLGKGSKKQRYTLAGSAEWINARLEDTGEGSKTGFVATAINGSELYATLTGGTGVRAMLALDNQLLVVAGRYLFSVALSGSPVNVIGGIPSDGFVTIERNRRTPSPQVMIVCDGSYYIYESGSVSVGADTDLPPPVFVIQHNGYFIAGIADGRWWIIGPDDTEVDGLLFAEAESNADGLVMGAVRGPDVILFGSKSADIYNDTGAADFPYTRIHALNVGCYAAGSVQKIIAQVNGRLVDTVIWAATDKDGGFAGLYMLDGFTPLKISNGEVDRLIRDETSASALRSMAWTEGANEDQRAIYAISGADFTMCFDTRTGEWHRRKTLGSERWQYGCVTQFGGETIFGSHASNTLHRSSPDLMDENGEEIVYSITPPTIHMHPHGFVVNALHVDALTGVGAVSTTDADANPKLLISASSDGGENFGVERQASLGAAGQRHVRVCERVWGMFREAGAVFRFQCSARVARGIQGLSLDVDKLSA